MARQNTVEVVIKAQDEASKTLAGIGDTIKTLGLAALAKEVAEAGIELAQLGSQAIAVEQRFVAFAGSSETAAKTLELVSAATQGTLSDMDAMQAATKLFQMGLAGSAEEAANLIGVATRLGDQTMSVSDRVADFAALLANQSTPRLDNFGISSGKVRERVAELQAQMPGLSRETAFVTATMEEAQESMDKLGGAGLDAQEGTNSLTAEIDNLEVALGKRLSPTLEIVSGQLATLVGNLADAAEELDSGQYDEALDDITASTDALMGTTTDLFEVTGGHYAGMAQQVEAYRNEQAAASEATANAIRSNTGATERYAASAQAYQDAIRASAEATSIARGEFITAAAALDELNEAHFVAAQLDALKASQEAGIISVEQYTAAQEALMVQFGLLTPQEQAAQQELDRLLEAYQRGFIGPDEYALKTQTVREKLINETDIANTQAALSNMEASYEAGKVPLDEYTRATEDLRDMLNQLEDKKITITVDYQGPANLPGGAGGGVDVFSAPSSGGIGGGVFESANLTNNTTTTNNFNMQINTRATQSNVLSDIRTMQALYGVR